MAQPSSANAGGNGRTLAVDARIEVGFTYRLRFTDDALDAGNPLLAKLMPGRPGAPARVLAFVDGGLLTDWPDLVERFARYVAAHPARLVLAGAPVVVPGGEGAKVDDAQLRRAVAAIRDAGLCRQSYVVAIGGGAMLDAVGFAAATAHRGVRLVRLPTTTLAQGDAGIGVKNGINLDGAKNYLGTFAVPWAVVNDGRLLASLSDRDWRCGFSEAVKVALLKDAPFFARIEALVPALAARDLAAGREVVRRSAELHLDHIASGGDPFEMLTARPLDFGHWSAHRLEQMTDFRVRHGEAVAIGLALDVAYSALDGRCAWPVAERVLACLEGLGFALYDAAMQDAPALLEGLEMFREHLGGELTITLLEDIGRPVDVHALDGARVREAIAYLARREAAQAALRPA